MCAREAGSSAPHQALAPTPSSSAASPRRPASPEITAAATRSRRRTCLLLLPLLPLFLSASLSPSHCSAVMAAPSFAGSRAARLRRDPAAPARIRILRSAAPRIRPLPSLPRRSARPPASPCSTRVDGQSF
ncbi:hypothetical protein VPH35_038761 [Triticum aestivum]